jgi:hypothetical protein
MVFAFLLEIDDVTNKTLTNKLKYISLSFLPFLYSHFVRNSLHQVQYF